MKYLLLTSVILTVILFGCAEPTNPATTNNSSSVLSISTTYDTVGRPYDLEITDDYVIVAEDQAGYSIFDRNSGDLLTRVVKRDDTTYYANARQLGYMENEKLLIVFDQYNGARLRFYDISDPTNPQFKDHYQGSGIDKTRYLQLFKVDDIVMISIANSNSIFRLSSFDVEIHYPDNFHDFTMPNSINGYVVGDEYIYFAAAQRGMYVFNYDVQDIGGFIDPTMNLVSELNMTGDALDIAVKGDYAYVVAKQEGLLVADISDPNNLKWEKDSSYVTSGWAQSISIEGNYLAVGSGGGGAYLFDIGTNPKKPVLLDRVTSQYTDYVYLVKLHNGELFTAGRYKGVTKFSINK